jgi:hypothetical protein
MTNDEIKTFRARAADKTKPSIYFRTVDGDFYKVSGFHANYKEPSDDVGEPVVIFDNGTHAALFNCDLSEFVTMSEAFPS